MARIINLRPKRPRKSLTRVAPGPRLQSAVGTSVATSTSIGQFGMIGTAPATTTANATANGSVGQSIATAVATGIFNAAASVGTAPEVVGAIAQPQVQGVPNVTLGVGDTFVPLSTVVTGFSGSTGASIATSASIAVGIVFVQEIADQVDFENRIKSLLPPSWFADSQETVLNIPVAGMSYGLLWIYILYLYITQQARIQTATDVWLDRIAFDFFGPNLPRLLNEPDAAFSARIRAEIVKQRQTRSSISKALTFLTNNAPKLIELWNPQDTGTYGLTGSSGIGTQGYGQAGMYGSLKYNNQFLVTAFRPNGEGIPGVPGYGNPAWGYGATDGGQYCDLNQIVARILDSDIYATIAAMIGAGNTAWTAILTPPDIIDAPIAYFGNVNNSSLAAIVGSGYWF